MGRKERERRLLICPTHGTEDLWIVEQKPGGPVFADVECRTKGCKHRRSIDAKQAESLLKRHRGLKCVYYGSTQAAILEGLFEFGQ